MSLRATVCRKAGPHQYPGTITLWYGMDEAGYRHSGQPFLLITVLDSPQTLDELAWLQGVFCRLTPDGIVRCKPDLINAAFLIGENE